MIYQQLCSGVYPQIALRGSFFPLLKIPSRVKLASVERTPSDSRSEQPHSTVGRRIALELLSARPATWIGPAWATWCGALASGAFALSGETLLRVAIAVLLADPLLGAWRAAWVNTDWRAPLRIWRPSPTRSWMLLPYARLDSPAARLSQWLSSRAKFWRSALWPEVGPAISALLVSGLIAVSVALVLGTRTFILTLLALLLAPLETELGARSHGQWARAFSEVGAAWLIGSAALARPSWDSILLAFFFACAYRGWLALTTARELGFALSNLAQIVVAVILVARGAMVHAGLVGTGVIAQTLWQALARRVNSSDTTYLARVQWFVLASMLVAAVGAPH